MKLQSFLPAAILLAALTLGAAGCRTTEANYRAAYDVAKAKASNPDNEQDPEVKARLEQQRKRRTTVYIVGRDTIDAEAMFLSRVDTVGRVPRFSVAVHGFEQQFNALAMMKRLKANGFPEAYVCKTAAPVFYVMTAGSDSINDIPAMVTDAANRAAALGMKRDGDYPRVIANAGWRP